MNEHSSLGIWVSDEVLENINRDISPRDSHLSIPFVVNIRDNPTILYEVIVMNCGGYYIYEFWIIEKSKLIKRFQKEIMISLDEFRNNFYVDENSTHTSIAEKYIRQDVENSDENKTNTL